MSSLNTPVYYSIPFGSIKFFTEYNIKYSGKGQSLEDNVVTKTFPHRQGLEGF